MIEARELDIPAPSTYMKCDFDPLPYFLVGDEIFPLKTELMIIFNYRLSQVHRTIENAFGILWALANVFHSNKRKN